MYNLARNARRQRLRKADRSCRNRRWLRSDGVGALNFTKEGMTLADEKPNLEMIAATLTAGLLAAHEMKPLAYDDAASVAVSYYRAVRKALLGDPFLR